METRCPSAHLVGSAVLPGHKLAFTIYSKKRKSGCADIIVDSESSVHGLLYTVSDADLHALDEFEGTPKHYRRIVVMIRHNKKILEAYAYEVVHKTGELSPSKEYMDLIETPAHKYAFPKAYIDYLKSIQRIEML
jgi:gamma-glutamylcyclotransferase (GGCT)/AIG2-like uncharacterized protein YtfP